jgi:hypothetical protein
LTAGAGAGAKITGVCTALVNTCRDILNFLLSKSKYVI